VKLDDLNIYDIGHKIGLVGAIFGDEDGLFLCMFPDQPLPPKKMDFLQMDLDDWKKLIHQTDLLETEVLSHTEHGKQAKTILRKSSRLVDQRVNWRVFKRDGYKCRYCGADDVPMTVDHLVLWEEGGPSIEENLVAACRKCNKTRGRMPYEDWLNSPYYRGVSQNVTALVLQDNKDLVATLRDIPRSPNRKERK